jgi:hypothetical protein
MSRKFPGPAGVACASAQLRSAKFGVQRCHLRSALAGMGPGAACIDASWLGTIVYLIPG